MYATIRQHGDVVTTEKATEKTTEKTTERDEGANGYVNGYVNGGANGEVNGELNSAQKATLNYIKENAGCNATEISDKTGVPFSTIDKHIRVLLKNGKIERRGSKKTGGYYVK